MAQTLTDRTVIIDDDNISCVDTLPWPSDGAGDRVGPDPDE